MTVDAAELDLPYLAVEEPDFAADPISRFAAAREQHPWLARCSIGFIITEAKALRELIALHDMKMVMGFNDIVEIMGGTGTPWGDFIAGTVQVQSGATHQRLRDALRSAFTPRQANRYRQVMRSEITRLLDEWVPKGAFDFEEFIALYPITVMCRMLGASPDVVPPLRGALEALGLAFSMDPKYLPEAQRGMGKLYEFAEGMVRERRATGPKAEPDLLDLILAARDTGAMDDAELYNLVIFVFAAGYDTSKNVLTKTMYEVAQRPEIYERCAADAEFCKRVMNEAMRFGSTSTATRRMMEDVELRGVRFPADTLVMLPWSVMGRDPSAFDHPDSFDPDRKGVSAHFTFGLGSHICLGQFIAKVQIEEAFHLIAQRIRKPQITGAVGWRPFPGVWGLAGLPIAFEAT
jgi:cytochrome P450